MIMQVVLIVITSVLCLIQSNTAEKKYFHILFLYDKVQ